MNWIKFLKLVLTFAASLTTYLTNKRIIEAAKSEIILQGLERSIDEIKKAKKARRDAVDKFDDSDGVPDESDPNLRD